MSWIVKRLDQGGGFLNKPGSEHAYTRSLIQAQKFPTYEAAKANCCTNETPQNLDWYKAEYTR